MEKQNSVDSIIRKAITDVHKLTGIAISRINADWIHVGTYGDPFQHALTYIEIDHAYMDNHDDTTLLEEEYKVPAGLIDALFENELTKKVTITRAGIGGYKIESSCSL